MPRSFTEFDEALDKEQKRYNAGVYFEKTDDTLYIQRWFIAECARAKPYNATATNPLMRDVKLSVQDNQVIIGVEEGYHAYQWLNQAKRQEIEALQRRMDIEATTKPLVITIDYTAPEATEEERIDKAYAGNAYEVGAVPIKRQALIDLQLKPYNVLGGRC